MAISMPISIHLWLNAMKEAERVVAREGGTKELQEKAQREPFGHGNVGFGMIKFDFGCWYLGYRT